MSLRPQQPLPPVPNDTARIARAAFRRGNPYVLLRDRLGAVFADVDFADLYPALVSRPTHHGASRWSRSCSSARG
jgi:transposase